MTTTAPSADRRTTKPKTDSPVVAAIAVGFGGLSCDGAHAKLPVAIARRGITLEEAERFFGGRQLQGTILARPEGAHADQAGIFGEEGDTKIAAFFDVHSYTVTPKQVKARLVFPLAGLDAKKLMRFANREGKLTVLAVNDLPETKALDAAGDAGEE